jgi:hypothetical protein
MTLQDIDNSLLAVSSYALARVRSRLCCAPFEMMNSSRAKHCLSTLYSAGGEMIINTNLQTTDAIGICVFLTKSSSPQVQLDVKRSTIWRVSKRALSLKIMEMVTKTTIRSAKNNLKNLR